MEALNWVCFILMPLCYAYLVIFGVRDTIIEKLTNLYIYTDPSFANRSKYTRGDWDSLNHAGFIRKTPIIFALMKKGILIIGIPFMSSLFSIFLFGIIPVNSNEESLTNISLMVLTVVLYYIFAILVIVYHRLSFENYKEKATMEKNLWEAKSILTNSIKK